MSPKISVIVPAFNCEQTLCRSIKSCIAQVDQDIEIIIVDDASTDQTVSVANRLASTFANVTVIHNTVNKKSLESRRIGFEHSHGEYITFLDADDTLAPDWFRDLLILQKDSGADIVASPIVPVYAAGKTPDYNTVVARRNMYSVPETEWLNEDIVHAMYRDGAIAWALVGKLFSRDLLKKSFSYVPQLEMFHAEDSFLMFVICTQAHKMISSAKLPAYNYYMGVGGTNVDQLISADQYGSICKNRLAIEQVYKYLVSTHLLKKYIEDYYCLRRNLCNDPASRFPQTIVPSDCLEALQTYLRAWPAEEVVSSLAATHWDDPWLVMSVASSLSRDAVSKSDHSHVIGIIYHSLGIGGIENVIRYQCQLFDQMGYQVILILDEGSEQLDIPKNVHVYTLHDCFDSYQDRYYVRAQQLKRCFENYHVDILLHHQWLGLTLPWDLLLARCLGIVSIVQVHGVCFSSLGYELSELIKLPLSYSIADAVLCLGAADAAYWRMFNSRVFVTQNPIDMRFFNIRPKGHDIKTVVWTGRLDLDKGLYDALIAAREVKQLYPNIQFKFYGPCDVALLDQLKKTVEDLGITECVLFCGPRTTEQLVEDYQFADVFLLSSKMEGWSMSLAEAKAAGLPCVMYDLSYLTLCQPNTGVLTAKVGDATGLGRQVARLLMDDQLRLSVSSQALNHAKQLAQYDYFAFWRTIFGAVANPDIDSEININTIILYNNLFDMQIQKINKMHEMEQEINNIYNSRPLISDVSARELAKILIKRMCEKVMRVI